MEVVPGIHTIKGLGAGRAYLIVEAGGLTLVDTGLRGSAKAVLATVAAVERGPDDIRRIVITHHHGDHTGALAELAERSGAEVLAHALDAPVIRGEQPPPGPRFGGPLRPLLARTAPTGAPARVDRELTGDEELDCLGGLRVLHTPGHTPGSISLYSAAQRLLFTGDAAMHLFGVRPPLRLFTEDRATARASLARLAALQIDVALFGHGRPIEHAAGRRFRGAAERLA